MLLSFFVRILYHIPVKKTLKMKKIIIPAAFIILSAAFISLIWNNNVWMDEAFTASLVHTDLAGVIERSMNDTLPPLYNIYLKLMTDVFGYSIPVMKIASVIPMLLTLFTGATTVRKRFGQITALLFMIFATFMPLMLYYGVEVRMYSLGFFFATAAGIYAYEIVADGSKKNWVIFTVLSSLAGYSHHFAFVTVAFAYFYLLLYFIIFRRDKLKNWFLCLFATFLIYLPCLLVTLKQVSRVSGYFSMPDIDLHMFIQYATYPYTVGIMPATLLCAAVMASSLIIVAVMIVRKNADRKEYVYALCCFSVYYGVLLFGTVISRIMTANIFVDRYLFFSTGLLWLSAAIVLATDRRTAFAAFAATAVIGACTYRIEFGVEYGETADEEIAFLRSNIREGDVYYSVGGHEEMQNCIPFYTYLDKETPELTFVTPLEEAVIISLKNKTGLWISVLDGYQMSEDDRETLEKYGLSMNKRADFEFDRYRCEFYKVAQ